MTLDEAIKHCEEVAEKQEKIAIYTPFEMLNSDVDIEKCQECANEHRQLAEWLKDYKRLLEEDVISRKKVIDTIYRECSGENLDIDFAKVLLLQRKIKSIPSVQSDSYIGK
jgi:hypothetical protein